MHLHRNNNQYCLLFSKKVSEDCFILSIFLWWILLETFWRKRSNTESVVSSAYLLRISIAPSASFFFGSLLTFTLDSPVKIYSLFHATKKIHINKAKYTIKCFYIFSHKFHKTVKFLIWIWLYYKKFFFNQNI